MKKIIVLFIVIIFSVVAYSQEGNLWKPYFERGIMLNENNECVAAEEQFKKAQQLLLDEFGLNDTTHSTYCHILYRRANNLYLIDDMMDSSYVCFKELYELSKAPIDSISDKMFRIESVIMLSSIDLERGNIRQCCDLLEDNKRMIDDLDGDTDLLYKYYFYKNLAKTYKYFVVSFLPEQKFDFLSSQYVIVRDGSFYNEYISVYKELVNLSYRYNSCNVPKITEDLILLAEHCNMFYDRSLAESTFESAFRKWKYIENHNNVTYLRLCKCYMSKMNKTDLNIYPFLEQNISKEFDSIVENCEISGLTFIDLLDFFSVRLQDKSLDNSQKEVFVNEPCDILAPADNFKILFNICYYGDKNTLESIDNIKIMIKYLSSCTIYFYEKEENAVADLLLNKAKFLSLLLPAGDRVLLRELNDAMAKSAEIIGDTEIYYTYKVINTTAKVATGMLPDYDDYLVYYNHKDNSNRIASIKQGIKDLGIGKYDKNMMGFYLSLIEAYLDSKNYILAGENIIIADSIIKLKERDGDAVSWKDKSDLLLFKAKCEYYKGETYKAIQLAKESNKNGGNIDAVELLTELFADNKKELNSIVVNQYTLTKSFIQDSYPFLSERERLVFSQSKQFLWFSSIPMYTAKYQYDTTLLSIAYNSALISKGTNISISTDIINNARENSITVLDEFIQQNIVQANDTNDHARHDRQFYLDVLEKEMQRFSGVSPQYLENHFGDWKELSANLFEDEVAIEFVEYVPLGESNPDNLYLGALYIKKKDSPHFINICKVDELYTTSIIIKQDWLSKIYSIVWQPVLKEMTEINRIWFSPSVHLFQINIESALPDNIDAYRVSSTRNILTLKDTPDFSEIALFGGLNYDKEDTQKEGKGFANHTAYYIIRDSNIDEERVGLTYLKGSLDEVISAKNILSPINHNIQLYVDSNGTEACFKELSGKGVSTLHVATHGFFIDNSDTITNIGNRVMRKSGLFMSGAKAIWKGGGEQYSGDDGILLSEEIENLDFSKLNLVVLSACGTGLGNPTNDGVYGLQRAFKKAGAQTIIMSLWNIDDNATALMMETFYKELVKTNSKHKAFHKAQSAARELYEDPYYWASFIMLD